MAYAPRWILRRALAAGGLLLSLAQAASAAGPEVVVTLKPLHGLVAAVMEGVGTPQLLLDGATSPHTYAMRPSDVRRLNKATIVVRVSRRLEVFLDKPLSLMAKARIVTADEIGGITLYEARRTGDFEAHAHHEDGQKGHDHVHRGTHAHTGKAEHRGQADDAIDPHIWLDPRNAKAIALRLSEVLAEADPAGASRLRDNGRRLAARLEALDAKLEAELAAVRDRPFLVFHDGYQYLERRYGLAGAGSVTVNPEVPPSARRLSEIRGRIKERGIVCVFAEPQFAPRVIATITEATSARQATLDPLGAAIPAGPGHYFALMDGLARDLKGCLAGPR
ncbi:MAG: zinc ABC transporter substrate-binding protein [Hyphomicrobiaceae bacterium]